MFAHNYNNNNNGRNGSFLRGWLPHSSVGPCVISCQMFVKSEFPLDSALV